MKWFSVKSVVKQKKFVHCKPKNLHIQGVNSSVCIHKFLTWISILIILAVYLISQNLGWLLLTQSFQDLRWTNCVHTNIGQIEISIPESTFLDLSSYVSLLFLFKQPSSYNPKSYLLFEPFWQFTNCIGFSSEHFFDVSFI